LGTTLTLASKLISTLFGTTSHHYCFFGPCPHRNRDYRIGSNFWKFYLNRTSFALGELVSLVKVFRLFRLERIVLVFRVWTQHVDVQHLICWQGQRVSDALFSISLSLSLSLSLSNAISSSCMSTNAWCYGSHCYFFVCFGGWLVFGITWWVFYHMDLNFHECCVNHALTS